VLTYFITNLVVVDEQALYSEPLRERYIDSFSRSACRTNFRFLQHDLKSLILLLEIPDDVQLSKGKTMPGQEVFLLGVYQCQSILDYQCQIILLNITWLKLILLF